MKTSTKARLLAVLVGAATLAAGMQVQAQAQGQGRGKEFGQGRAAAAQQAGPGRPAGAMQQRGGQGRGMMMGRRPGVPSLQQLDANADGMIDLDEFLARHEDRPQPLPGRLDANGDGLLSREELTPPARPERPGGNREAVLECMQEEHPGMAGPDGIAERFDTLDTNDDSLLDAEELAAGRLARAEEQFNRLDADADGLLTPDELRAQRADRRELGRSLRECRREAAQPATP